MTAGKGSRAVSMQRGIMFVLCTVYCVLRVCVWGGWVCAHTVLSAVTQIPVDCCR